MALWQWLFGIGLGTVLTILAMNVQSRQIHSSRRKNDTFLQDINDNCPVCLCEMEPANTVYLNCCHAIHESCLGQLRSYSRRSHTSAMCPQCRQKI